MSKTIYIEGQGHVAVTMCPPRAAMGAFDSRIEFLEDHNPIIPDSSLEKYLAHALRHGACDDDCESTATAIHGDHREDEDAFFSRPLRIRDYISEVFVDTHRQAHVEAGFEESVRQSLLANVKAR